MAEKECSSFDLNMDIKQQDKQVNSTLILFII
jgi:hypothetical protein